MGCNVARRTWTPEQRANALAIYRDHGPAEASRRTGIPGGTIASWANRAGVQTEAPAKTAAAVEAAKAKRDRDREELRILLVAKAVDLLQRLDEPYHDYRGKDADRVEWDRPPAEACKAYATAAAILVDKFRLELGEATDRTEHLGTVDRAQAEERLATILTLAERRAS